MSCLWPPDEGRPDMGQVIALVSIVRGRSEIEDFELQMVANTPIGGEGVHEIYPARGPGCQGGDVIVRLSSGAVSPGDGGPGHGAVPELQSEGAGASRPRGPRPRG